MPRGTEGANTSLPATSYSSAMTDTIVVSEWDSDIFHQKVMELEAQGYVARRDTYRITAEMNPETGIVSHLHSMELYRPTATKP